MLFVEFRFLPFFAVALIVTWSLRSNSLRKLWLLACSYFFYAAWDWRFLGLILFSTSLDWLCGARIHAARGNRRRMRLWLALSLIGNLGLLGTFKYADFFAESLNALLHWLGLGMSTPMLNLILPVGISFYTFQTLSYSLDIYFGKLEPSRRFLDLALFVAFFPQLVAGPIVLAKELLPQFDARPSWASVPVRGALVLFFVGFIKKSCLSDSVAPYVNVAYDATDAIGTWGAWLAAIAFSSQVYFDFSGYTDMAIACAALLGYRLPRNFDYPYLATNFTAVWSRWHITLTRWFRAYVYIPLGGSRKGEHRTLLNIFIIFAVSGLWHGSAWNFVGWGVLHGVIVAIERTDRGSFLTRLPWPIGFVYLQVIWILSLVIFRSANLDQLGNMLAATLTPTLAGEGAAPIPYWLAPVLVGALAVHWLWRRYQLETRWAELSPTMFAASYGALCALALPWIRSDPAPYFYFDF